MHAAEQLALAPAASRQVLLRALAARMGGMLERGEEAVIREALREPSSPLACRELRSALDLALTSGDDNGAVNMQVFAIPVLFVTGASEKTCVPGVIPDTNAIQRLFEESGVLGHCRTFGLSNALAALDSVEAIPLQVLRSIAHGQSWHVDGAIDLPPAQITVEANREKVDLRFVCGAALTAANAPAFTESAGDIGRWGMALMKELGRQLAVADASLLMIPRQPRSIVRASQEGWFAARELGFQLFLSNALREARMRVGEPDVTISTTTEPAICVRLSSPFDDMLDQTYGWPLAPCDDLDAIEHGIFSLLQEARVERIEINKAVMGVRLQR